jgi:hypothetical protein
MSQELAPDCRGCTRAKGNRCLAIIDPEGVWRNGECWAYTCDPHWYEKYLRAVKDYAAKKL